MTFSAAIHALHETSAPERVGDRAASRLADVRGLISREMIEVEEQIGVRIAAGVAPATDSAKHLFDAGGKRVRPMALLLAHACFAPVDAKARGLAAAAELVHMATLLHDDVIDDGLTRRGLPAPRIADGNGVSVLAGDWLLTTSLDLALRSHVPGAVEALVRTLRRLVEGEARQLALRGSAAFAAEDALQIAELKTGALFAWCGEAGALAARAPEDVREALREFGLRCGVAFQIADDLLDFEADAATLGKAVLADVAEGKPSLPLAIALKRLPPLRGELEALLLLDPATPELEQRTRTRAFAGKLSRTGALGAARRLAEKERDAALEALARVPSSPTRELLEQVAQSLLARHS